MPIDEPVVIPPRESRRWLVPADFGESGRLVMTVLAGLKRTLRNGESYPVLVFRERLRADGSTSDQYFDMRLNATDVLTLTRIYGVPRQWVGEFVILEVRMSRYMAGPLMPHVRVAFPATWREMLPDVVPVNLVGDAADIPLPPE